ncbi:MAG TPA: hypothetical protein VGO80_00875 [Solirubrobacteraceae bacterium]|jgi:hypothetical protein|nr:hypothetical protein [Solirubrobacteraceae bacterium]
MRAPLSPTSAIADAATMSCSTSISRIAGAAVSKDQRQQRAGVRNGLRGYDAVQLASDLRAAADVSGTPSFVWVDRKLNAAAAAEGLTCLLS